MQEFDISNASKLLVEGQRAEDFLKSLIPASMDELQTGKFISASLCDENGDVLDDVLVYMYSTEKYMLVVNVLKTIEVYTYLAVKIYPGIEISNVTEDINLQGHESIKITK